MKPVVVITGAGSGLGQSLTLEFVHRGYEVFGTAFNQEEIDAVTASTNGKARLLRCDIAQAAQVADFAAQVAGLTNGKTDILINNAGILTPGPLEVVPLDAVRKEFEVNTFGVLSVINAFLPMLRATRGRIVLVSTLSVDRPSAFNGLSAASKAAVETLMTIYSQELASFGIEITTAVPASIRTGGPAKTAAAIQKVQHSFTPDQSKLYGEAFDQFAQRINAAQSQGQDALEAAREIADLATKEKPPFRQPIGDEARSLTEALRLAKLEELKKQTQ